MARTVVRNVVKTYFTDTFASLTKIGAVPSLSGDGINYEYSGATVDPTTGKWIFDKSIEVPSGSVDLGEVIILGEGANNVIIRDSVEDKIYYGIRSEFNTSGSSAPTYRDLEPEFLLDIQTDFGTTITTNPLFYSITGAVVAPKKRQVNVIYFKTGAVMINTRIKVTDNVSGVVVRYLPDKVAWDSGVGGFDLVSGDNTIDMLSDDADTPGVYNVGINPFLIQEGQQLDFEIVADSVSILGNVSEVPYLKADVQDFLEEILATSTVSDLADRVQSTGLLEGGVISEASSTTVDWTSGEGQVADHTDPLDSETINVTWDAVSGQSVTDIATDGTTLFGYDSAGSIVEKLATAVTIEDAHDVIWFGSVFHLSGAIVDTITAPGNIGYDGIGSFSDFMNLVIGPANVNGNIYGANGANLNIDVLGGTAYFLGANFRTSTKISDVTTLLSLSALSFRNVYRSAGVGLSVIYGSLVTTIDPNNYDDGSGTLVTTTTDYWTIQRIFRSRTGKTYVSYGQQEFASKVLALEAKGNEPFTEKVPLPFTLYRCSLVIKEGATDLSDTDEAEFFAEASFRAGGAQSASSVIPGITSPGGADGNVQYNDSSTFGGSDRMTWSNGASQLSLKSASGSGTPAYRLLDSGGTLMAEFEYLETSDTLQILSTATTMQFGQPTGLIEFLGNDTDFQIEMGGTTNAFTLNYTDHPDTQNIVSIVTGGTNGGDINFHVGNRNPEGNVTADGGAIYYRDSGTDSDLYLKRSDGGNTGWIDFLHSSSGIIGPATTVVNDLVTWGDTTGNTLLNISNITASENVAVSNISLTSPGNPGEAQLYFYDETSTLAGSLFYSAGTESMILTAFSDGDLTILSAASDVIIKCNTASSEVIITNNSGDTANVMAIQTEGSNGEKTEFFTGNRDPNGNVTALPGSIYFEANSANSAIYQYRSASVGNTAWVELGDVVGQSISVNDSLAFFSGTSGKRIDGSGNFTVTTSASSPYLNVKSPQLTSTGAGYRLLNSLDSVLSEFKYDEANNFTYLVDNSANGLNIYSDDGEITLTTNVASSAISVDLITPNATGFSGLVLSNNVGTTKFSLLYSQALDTVSFTDESANGTVFSTDSKFLFSGQGLNDTDSLMQWNINGTNPAVIDVYLTDRNPEGNITAIPGAVAFRQDGINSDVYIKRSVGSSNTGWADLLTTGIKTDETTTEDNALTTWDGTTADKIQQVSGITALNTGAVVGITLEIPDALDIAEITFADENGVAEMEFVYDDSNSLTSIVSNTTDFKLEATAGSIEINTATGQAVTVNENLRFIDTGTISRIEFDTPLVSSSSRLQFNDNVGTQIGRLLYHQGTDVIDLEVLDTSTTLSLVSSQQPINFTVNQASAAKLLVLNNNNVNISIFGRQLSPQAQVSGIPGDLTILADERLSSLYMRRDAGTTTTGTSWAEVQFVQRKYEDVSTTQTLQRNASVISAIPTTDIDITLPNPDTTAVGNGFTQTITKGITNDNVISIVTPGFYGHSGDFIMSRRGDSVTYIQTGSSNEVLEVNREVFAVMSKGVAETSIAGLTGAEIIFTGFTANEFFYYGLCEPDQANDKINFPNVENLIDGDLYEVEFFINMRHDNNSVIEFFVTVDDSGIATNYPLHMRETSSSTTDDTTLSGKTYIRTGITSIPIDTSLQVYFELATGYTLFSRRAYLKLNKIEGR